MRFDFRWPGGALSAEQKRAVAQRVNEMIREDYHLETRELPIEEAKATGAISMAGEKYGESVRVVTAGPSIEFCGGTHSHSTGELGNVRDSLGVVDRQRHPAHRVVRFAGGRSGRRTPGRPDRRSLAVAGNEAGRAWRTRRRLQSDVRDLQKALGQLKARLAAADAQAYVRERRSAAASRAFVGAVVREANAEALKRSATRFARGCAAASSRWSASTATP